MASFNFIQRFVSGWIQRHITKSDFGMAKISHFFFVLCCGYHAKIFSRFSVVSCLLTWWIHFKQMAVTHKIKKNGSAFDWSATYCCPISLQYLSVFIKHAMSAAQSKIKLWIRAILLNIDLAFNNSN